MNEKQLQSPSVIQEGYNIGELAELAGVSAKTIRYYEKVRVLPAPFRQANGYRIYTNDTLDKLKFIRSAQAIGLTLGEIREIITMRDDGQVPCAYVLELIRTHSNDISKRIADLELLKGELEQLAERGARLDPADCPPSTVCHVIAHLSSGDDNVGGSCPAGP